MARIYELTDEERSFIDKVNKINRKIAPNDEISLWNVCKAYLNKKIQFSILDLPKNEIMKILRGIN